MNPAATPPASPHGPSFLLGIDLEDVRMFVPGGERYRDRVPAMVDAYLEFFAGVGAKSTFFVVGELARRHPALVRRLHEAGHEVACHGDSHTQLDRLTPAQAREELRRSAGTIADLGIGPMTGFRAPTLSLKPSTAWMFDALAEAGFTYSSSVLPAANPLYGWPGFGGVRRMSGVWEIPVTLLPRPLPALPFVSGIYLRVLPGILVAAAARLLRRRGLDLVGYVHPYDIDAEQERFRHPFTENNWVYHRLMYLGRSGVLSKLRAVLRAGYRIERYSDYAGRLAALPTGGAALPG